MLTGIDHLVIGCADPDAAAADLERTIGLAPGGGERHEALGTYNRIIWLGDSYLELIGVFDRELAARSWIGAPSLRAIDGGGGLATWALATNAIDEDVARLNARGANLAAPIDGERRGPDGSVVRWRLAAPRELGPGMPPFLIEHDVTTAEWTAPERATRAALTHPLGASVRLDTLELEVPDIVRTIGALMRTVGIGPFRPSLSGRRTRDAPIGRQTVRLRATMGIVSVATWPVATIHLRAVPVDATATPVERRTIESPGCRFIVAP